MGPVCTRAQAWGLVACARLSVDANPTAVSNRSGIECLNSGFVALRNTRAAWDFLNLWQQKIWWAVSWDQSAFAETVLEMVGLEVAKMTHGMHGYSSQCLRYLFPIANGLVPYAMYCDCWQSMLGDLIGPYRQRRSRVIGFVDPERVDVNFVPSDLFVGHGFDLRRMRLLPHEGKPALDPLIVHWAGTGKHRLWVMEKYLAQRFNVSLAGCPRRPPLPGQGFGSRARAVRCCDKLKSHAEEVAAHRRLLKEEVAFWGCCAWRPVSKRECLELAGLTAKGSNESQPALYNHA